MFQSHSDSYCNSATKKKSTGTIFEVLSEPVGFMRQVSIQDIRRNLNPENVTEKKLRQEFRFVN